MGGAYVIKTSLHTRSALMCEDYGGLSVIVCVCCNTAWMLYREVKGPCVS